MKEGDYGEKKRCKLIYYLVNPNMNKSLEGGFENSLKQKKQLT
jgi:hypothetical protein